MDQLDLLAWPQEYLNEPRPSETQMFHPDKWPQYEGDPHRLALQQNLTALQFWDLAISEKTTADYTVGWTIGVSEDNDIFILERRRGHFDFNRTLNEIADMGKAWPGVAQIGIEQVAYQAAAVQEALRRSMLPIVPVVPD
jgi:phage terminase large subunit-like protein